MNMAVILNLFPGMLAMIAVYFVLRTFGLTNSYIGLILVYCGKNVLTLIPSYALNEVHKSQTIGISQIMARTAIKRLCSTIVYLLTQDVYTTTNQAMANSQAKEVDLLVTWLNHNMCPSRCG